MSATLIAVIFALVLGHLAPGFAASVRRHDGFGLWLRWLDARFGDSPSVWRGHYGVLFALLPPLLLVGLIQFALHSPLAGVFGLLFAVAMLFYAWGPRDLDVDVSAVVDAENPAARRDAAARLDAKPDSGLGEAPAMVEAVFANALRRWFGVLFWFLLFGAVGAVLYRFAALLVEGEYADALPASTREGARRVFALLNWPVAQAMTLSLALVGNFDSVLGVWRDAGGAELQLDHAHLGAAARASVRCEIAEETRELIEEGATPGNAWVQLGELPELRDAMSLVWRILLLWLAILALFVVAGWVS
ncbi:MAG: cobalamin biosynthesis protein [Pseudomonadota bacterium]